MKRIDTIIILSLISILCSAESSLKKSNILKSMQLVADWELLHFEDHVKNGSVYENSHAYWAWTNGTMYLGMLDWAKLSNDKKYLEFLKNVAAKAAFKPGPNQFHADDICVSQLYLELFSIFKDSNMIKPTIERLKLVVGNRSQNNLDYSLPNNGNRWSWCDALFMAPPVYARAAKITCNTKYLDFMNEEYKTTYDTLYDTTQKLFSRDIRYKYQKEANGEKVFWGRGNGWVIGGLCMIIDNLPPNHPYRKWYISLYLQMIKRVAKLQDRKGFWHSSLLDPQSYPMPETSCSGFFTYGIAWGINNKLLPAKQYKPIVIKGWKALCSAVHTDGKLGWVQPIGEDPKKVTSEMTDVYGVGAFLLAGSQMYKLK